MRLIANTTILGLVILFSAGLQRANAEGWISPTSTENPEAVWVNPGSACDGNTSTYSQDVSNRAGYGAYVVFNLDHAINCERVRVFSDFGYNIVDKVQVDVNIDGGWRNVLDGPITDAAYSEIDFVKGMVSQIRYRYHYVVSGYIFWLYEVSAYESPTPVVDPTVATVDATSVDSGSAVLHGQIINAGGAPCQYRFIYGPSGSPATFFTSWSGPNDTVVTGQQFGTPVSGLTAGIAYHFRPQVQNPTGNIIEGADHFLDTQPANPNTWVTPAYVFNPGSWENAQNAIDDETGTYARDNHVIFSGQWGDYLTLSHPLTINVTAIRFMASADAYVDMAQVDLSTDNTNWTTVFLGSFSDQTFKNVPITPVDAVFFRIRFHVSTTAVGEYWHLYQFNFTHNSALVAPNAAADSYVRQYGQPLTVSAPGVLANDTDPDNKPMTASKVADPTHGTVTLNPDGSFTYTPDSGSTQPDSFTYQVTDGTYQSNIATVHITIQFPPPTIAVPASANPNPVAGPQTALSVLGDDVLGESSLTYTWTTTGTPPAAVIFSANGTNAAKNTNAQFTAEGTYNFQVTAKDAGGLTATSSVSVAVNGPAITVNMPSVTMSTGDTLTSLTAQLFPVPPANVTVTISQTGGTNSLLVGVESLTFSAGNGSPQAIPLTAQPVLSLASDNATLTLSAPGYPDATVAVTIQPSDSLQTVSPLVRATSTTGNAAGLAFQSAQGGATVPVLQPAGGSRLFVGSVGADVSLTATIGVGNSANVTFVCMSGGYLYTNGTPANPVQKATATIATDVNGNATVKYHVNQSGKLIVVASSPTCSGQVRFVIKAQ